MTSFPPSPLFPEGHVSLLKTIEREWLVSIWKRKCKVDVSPWLPSSVEIRIFRCETSGLEFYDPPSLAAPPAFYALLQQNGGGYYPEEKWEFLRAVELTPSGSSALDVGCGDGAFMRLLRDKRSCRVRGLETNETARRAAESAGAEVFNELSSEHRHDNTGRYDVVTSFQVLEHLVDPLGFLLDLKNLVRRGGLVIVAVPNARSYLDWVNNPMDMPPHHMTRWDAKVFAKLPISTELRLCSTELEPLQPGQVDIFLNAAFHRFGLTKILRSDSLTGLVKSLLSKILGISWLRRRFHGQSLLVVFQRT